MVRSQREQENEIRAAIERGERMRRDGRVYKLAVYRGGQVKNVVLTVAKDGQRTPAGNVYDRIMREKGEPPRWDEWRRAYVPEGNKIYAYKTEGDRDNAFDATRKVLVAHKLRFETYLDRKLYGVPLRPSNMYMALDMSTEAWIDNGEGDCVPRQLALVIGQREVVERGGGFKTVGGVKARIPITRTREFVPKYTVDQIKKKLPVFAELSKWEPGCSTPEHIADFCYTEGHPFR